MTLLSPPTPPHPPPPPTHNLSVYFSLSLSLSHTHTRARALSLFLSLSLFSLFVSRLAPLLVRSLSCLKYTCTHLIFAYTTCTHAHAHAGEETARLALPCSASDAGNEKEE